MALPYPKIMSALRPHPGRLVHGLRKLLMPLCPVAFRLTTLTMLTCPWNPTLWSTGALCVPSNQQLSLVPNNSPVPLGLIGRRQLFLTVSGWDHTTSPNSPTLSHVTLQVTGQLIFTSHTERMLHLWNNQAWKFALMNGCC
jgi:hypothetical protein